MQVILEVRSGKSSGKKIVLNQGESIRVGRAGLADISFVDDSHMSGVHFCVECGEKPGGCLIDDLHSSNGTFLNGVRSGRAVISDGDTIVAGQTTFFVRMKVDEQSIHQLPAAAAGECEIPKERLLEMFRQEYQPLYAVLDAAAEPSVLKVLFESKEEYQSLYEGPDGAQLAHFAPYVVRLPQDSPLLRILVEQGWGKNWGIYLTCDQTLTEVRRHLRHFLMVRMPDAKQVYFRFYDPRVLRAYLPTCARDEISQLFGPIREYLIESEKAGRVLRFANTDSGSEGTQSHLAKQQA